MININKKNNKNLWFISLNESLISKFPQPLIFHPFDWLITLIIILFPSLPTHTHSVLSNILFVYIFNRRLYWYSLFINCHLWVVFCWLFRLLLGFLWDFFVLGLGEFLVLGLWEFSFLWLGDFLLLGLWMLLLLWLGDFVF